MKLRNRKTGEIWDIPKMRHPTCQEDDISFFAMQGGDGKLFSYHSIAELNEEWEDYKPDAIEKAKAWERLKDKGFRFDGVEVFSEGLLEIDAVLPALEEVDYAERIKMIDDLALLFGEEEE